MEASLSNTVTFIYENNVPQEYTVGIDLLFFGTSPDPETDKQGRQSGGEPQYQPKGIKLVPAGIHIVHLTNSIINYRVARYVECSEGDVFVIKFNDTSSGTSNNNKDDSNTHLSSLNIKFFKNIENEVGNGNNKNGSNKLINEFNKLISILPFMVNFENCLENFKIPFPNNPNSNIYTMKNWLLLTQGLTINKISKFIIKASDIQKGSIEIINDDDHDESKTSELISTDDSSVDEYKKIQKILGLDKDHNKRFTNDESSLNLLNLTDLDWRNTIRKNKNDSSNIQQITKDYLDKTWFFNNTFGNNKFNFLIELKFTFLNSIVLNNFNSLNHWIEMIKLILNMKNYFIYDKDGTNQQFLSQFLSLIYLQLSIIPIELVSSNKNEFQEQQQSLNSISIEKKLKTDFSKFLSTLDETARIDLQLSYNSIIQLLESKFNIFVYQLLDEEDDKDEIEEDFVQGVYDHEMEDANDSDDDGDDYHNYNEYLQFD
ncbi:hypothetical protein B5S33_g1243 [[Candida] boidinii]|nr:hypothetical protein B5S33_g1243 [[Candida] boidinii]